MRRREFITLLGGAAAAWPLAARAQQAERVRRIGVLMASPRTIRKIRPASAAFLQGLQQLGWTDGRNVRIDTAGRTADADAFADTRRNWSRSRRTSSWPTGTATVAPLLQATRTVPIVFVRSSTRSAPASSRAWRGRAATPPASPSSNTA